MLTAYGKVLPVGFVCDRYALLEPSPVSRTEEEAAALAAALLDERERAELGRAEITSSSRTGGWKTGSISSPAPTPASRTSGWKSRSISTRPGAGG